MDQFDIEQIGPVVTVRLKGPQVSGPHMQNVVDECAERVRCHNASCFILDMAEVQFLDSASLGVLVSLLQDLEHVRGRLVMVHCQDNVAFLFKVTRLDSAIPLFDDEKEAMAGF